MTNEEALKLLRQTPWLSSDEKIKLYPAIALAIKALEKQIPKEYEYEHIGGHVACYCPACQESYVDNDYCPHCGQRIDWGK